MKKLPFLFLLVLLSTPIASIWAADGHKNTLALEFVNSPKLSPGQTAHLVMRLTNTTDGSPVTLRMLKTVHTKKFHLLVIDPSLSDYHHLHPVAGKRPGEYEVNFVPQGTAYRVWGDVTPVASDEQQYVQANLGGAKPNKKSIDQTERLVTAMDGYTFKLSFENKLKAGEPVMASLLVTKDGKTFSDLRPVMGAFAHVVGFTSDYQSVIHVHPLGQEPKKEADRGGPELQFHFELDQPGFTKIFAQFRIDGKDLFVPFGVNVE